MTHDDPAEAREAISRLEALEYVESLLPDLAILAAGESLLVYILGIAHLAAMAAVARLGSRQEANGHPGPATRPREAISRLEALEYVESLLPDLAILAARESFLVYILRIAHLEATAAVARLRSRQEAGGHSGPADRPRLAT